MLQPSDQRRTDDDDIWDAIVSGSVAVYRLLGWAWVLMPCATGRCMGQMFRFGRAWVGGDIVCRTCWHGPIIFVPRYTNSYWHRLLDGAWGTFTVSMLFWRWIGRSCLLWHGVMAVEACSWTRSWTRPRSRLGFWLWLSEGWALCRSWCRGRLGGRWQGTKPTRGRALRGIGALGPFPVNHFLEFRLTVGTTENW